VSIGTRLAKNAERRAWQIAVAVLALIPVGAGLEGIVRGPRFIDLVPPSADLDSQFRYLSGILLAVGLGFWTTIRKPENRVERFGGLTLIVFLGGLARLIWVIAVGVPSMPMLGGLVMELVVTPLMFLWQLRLADAQRASIIVG
jgi:Domain of unknown function (DUF4345)